MTELELVGVLNKFFKDGLELSELTYVIIAAISFLFGTLGSFVSSFMKKSGELKAVENRLNTTITQLQKQTETVENVKNHLSNKVWIEQQKWEFRKAIFIELINLLLKIKSLCEEAENYLNQVPSLRHIEDDSQHHKTKDDLIAKAEGIYDGKVSELTDKLKKLLNEKGLLFLSDEVIAVLREYFDAEKIRRQKVKTKFETDLAAGKASIHDASYIDNYEQSLYHKSKAAERAYILIVQTAKRDLKING